MGVGPKHKAVDAGEVVLWIAVDNFCAAVLRKAVRSLVHSLMYTFV